ncbi:MAG: hypothetical protein LW832_08375 [Parachlamydia sp.]|jgi:tetratricopeptide (TPR) repeat protein|nr:hypothetical protein [Parachlamydia sp.]
MNAEREILIQFDKELSQEKAASLIPPAIQQFRRILKINTFFNAFFIVLLAAQIIYFFIHIAFLVQNFVLGIHIALFFATLFSYFTMRLYFQTQKNERLIELKEDFLNDCKEAIPECKGIPELHLVLAECCCKLAAALHGSEYELIKSPLDYDFLAQPIEKISCILYWEDVHFMKELLLNACIEEHLKMVRIEPTHLETHATLANAYVMLSGLYIDPRTVEGLDDEKWIPKGKFNEGFRKKFRMIAGKAIEEFKILSDYAPQDPWVHAQLAYSYRDLQMAEEEIKEYEIILQLCPEDRETLFKLGKLYFEQGYNAKGLQVYESLKRTNYKKAEDLILHYGASS